MITSGDVWKGLKKRFCAPEWAIFPEVANGTGGNCRRHIDAMAFNMYPSRGLGIIAIEIKVDRGDLKRELANPDKAEEIACYCNEFWIAVPEGLVTDQHDIPVTWGVMELLSDGSMRVKKRAEWFQRENTIPKEFLMAVIRSCGKLDDAIIGDIRAKAYEDAKRSKSWDLRRAQEDLERLTIKVKEFEKITGKAITGWTDCHDLAEKIKLAESLDRVVGRYGNISVIRRKMQDFLKVTDQLDVFENQEASS